MAKPVSHHDLTELEIDRKKLKSVLQRFLDINQKRLEILVTNAEEAEQNFIHLLPLLFHINHPTLPGFVHSDAPCGLVDVFLALHC